MLAGLSLMVACSDDKGASPATTSDDSDVETPCASEADLATAATTINATLTEWSITLSANTAKAGKVAFVATNTGAADHELVVVKAENAAALPMAADGTVNEDAIPEAQKPGEIGEFTPGRSCGHLFDLAPGAYVLFCNVVSGDAVHVKNGMITTFTVTA